MYMSDKVNPLGIDRDSIEALRYTRDGNRLIYTYAGCISVSGRKIFPIKNIRNLIDKGFMKVACIWTVEITNEGELFINAYEGRHEGNL